ncbi:MAG: hypothetical protein AAGI45_24780 [Cyanobacteria bacterium P01_H01_bin.26]
MLIQQIMQELQALPEEKLVEIYDLIHYFRVGLSKETNQSLAVSEVELRTPGILPGKLGDAFFEPLPEEELQKWE